MDPNNKTPEEEHGPVVGPYVLAANGDPATALLFRERVLDMLENVDLPPRVVSRGDRFVPSM